MYFTESVSEYFNSQPHKEADEETGIRRISCEHFNSQPHKEADDFSSYNPPKSKSFQLTASQGG